MTAKDIRLDLLSAFIDSDSRIKLDDTFRQKVREINPAYEVHLFNSNRTSVHDYLNGHPSLNSFNPFTKTPRYNPRDGKGVKPIDKREEFINGWDTSQKELEVYREDPIPLTTYKSMSFNTKIKLGTQLIVGFATRLQFEILSSDPEKAALTKYLVNQHYNQLVRDMVTIGLRNGWWFGEKVWERRTVKITDASTKEVVFQGRAVVPVKIKSLDPCNNFSYWIDTKSDELVRIEQEQSGKIVHVPRKKVMWFTYNKEYSNIFGVSAYRAAYNAWYYGNGLKQAMLMKLDTTGEPILVVRFPTGNNILNGDVIPNDVVAHGIAEKVQNEKTIILPSAVDKESGVEQWDIKYVELKNSENDPYLKAIEFYDKEMVEALGIFGNIIAGEANFSEIDAKEDLTIVMIEGLVDQIERCIQEDLVDWITAYNFGPKHIDDVRIHIDRNSLGRTKMLKDLLVEMMRIASSEKNGRPKKMPSIERIGEALGVPMEDYNNSMDRSMIDKQMEAEKKNQPKPVLAPGAKPAAKPNDAVKEAQRKEDSNGKNRKTTPVREKGRPSAEERLK